MLNVTKNTSKIVINRLLPIIMKIKLHFPTETGVNIGMLKTISLDLQSLVNSCMDILEIIILITAINTIFIPSIWPCLSTTKSFRLWKWMGILHSGLQNQCLYSFAICFPVVHILCPFQCFLSFRHKDRWYQQDLRRCRLNSVRLHMRVIVHQKLLICLSFY